MRDHIHEDNTLRRDVIAVYHAYFIRCFIVILFCLNTCRWVCIKRQYWRNCVVFISSNLCIVREVSYISKTQTSSSFYKTPELFSVGHTSISYATRRLYLGTRRGANKNILLRPHVRVATGNVFFSWGEKHGCPDYAITTAYSNDLSE